MASSSWSKTRDPDEFPTLQLFVLAIVRLAEPIALTSIFPYSWELVKRFGVGEEKDASFYSGLLISAFSLAEALTGMFWGSLSDKIGRKPVILCGCAGTVLSIFIIGFARSFWVALAGRAIGGLLNGNISVIQTMVGELVKKPEHEPRAYSIMPFVWSMGTIIGPAIGGTFVEPARSFPGLFSPGGIFGQFPYLLSNLICACILIFSILIGFFLLEETHPNKNSRPKLAVPSCITENSPLVVHVISKKKKKKNLKTQAKAYRSCQVQDDGIFKEPLNKSAKPQIFTKRVTNLVIAMGIFCYHTMSFDQLLPVYFEDKPAQLSLNAIDSLAGFQMSGGLGLSVQQVGFIMSVDGALAIVVQALVFPFAASYFGVQRTLIITSIMHPLTFLIMPYLVYLSGNWLYVGIYFCLAIRNLLTIVAFSSILILIKEATPSLSVLGKVNGLASSVGAAARTIAPPVAGYIYSLGVYLKFSGLVWYLIALVAVIGAIQVFTIRGSRCRSVEEGWTDEEVPTLVNSSVNSSDDETDNECRGNREIESDYCSLIS